MWKVILLVFLCGGSVLSLPFEESETTGSQKIGAYCEDYDECDEIPNAICNVYSEECECKDDYVTSENKTSCLELAEELGDECVISEQCKNLGSAVCVENRCETKKVAQDSGVKIVSSETKTGRTCSDDSECSPGTCQFGVCIAATGISLGMNIIGKTCSQNTDCPTEGSACTGNICRCKEEFVASQNLKSCLSKADSIGSTCNETAQCIHLDNSICENGKCTGLKVPKVFQGPSIKIQTPLKLGSSCSRNDDCSHLSNAICKENVCQCIDNYVISLESNSCLSKAKQEGDSCEIDKQCSDIKSICSKNKCVKPAAVGRSLDNQPSAATKIAPSIISGLVAASFYFILKSFRLNQGVQLFH